MIKKWFAKLKIYLQKIKRCFEGQNIFHDEKKTRFLEKTPLNQKV